MIGVGEKFPAFKLQGVNKDNEFVEVSVTEHYDPEFDAVVPPTVT